MPEISADDYAKLVKRSAGYGQLKTQYGQLKTKHEALEVSHAKVTKDYGTLETEHTKLKEAPVADATSADERVVKLTAENRAIRHRQVFDKLAKGKVKEEGLDDFWSLTGYKPEADDCDEAAMGTLIADQLAKRPLFAFQSPTPETPPKPGAPVKTNPTTPVTAAEGSARGGGANQAGLDASTAVNAKYAATGRNASTVPGRI